MRIISDFKDYYDTAQGFGIDPTLRYMRTLECHEYQHDGSQFASRKQRMPRDLNAVLREPIKFVADLPNRLAFRWKNPWSHEEFKLPFTPKIIGFCGELFPAIEADGCTYTSIQQLALNVSDDFLAKYEISRSRFEERLNVKLKDLTYGLRLHPPVSYEGWEARTKDIGQRRYDEVFIKLGAPIFKVEYVACNDSRTPDKIRCTINPHLKRDNFQKVKPPTEAFQEISMYLGNQLARQPDPMGYVSDEVMRDQKGFDEWSFRRHKEDDKKRLKRKRRQDHPN